MEPMRRLARILRILHQGAPMLTPTARRASLCVLLLALIPAALACVQAPPQGKTFDVVSIRQNISNQRRGPMNLTASPDGFHVEGQALQNLLLTAYTTKAGGLFLNNIQNLPDWGQRDRYNVDARISDDDRGAWNDPKNQPAMLEEMLQAMLADRFKLVVHREVKEKPVYELVIAKSGAKFAETKPDEARPAGQTLPGGGVMGQGADGATHMYNMSMNLLAALLTSKSDRTVLDKTGLTGRYSLDIREPQQMAAPSAGSNGESEDERRPAVADALKSVGLELKSAKDQVELLVIDHVDRPTEN
jgi:uncharacterized protein (TIGR03435 family)